MTQFSRTIRTTGTGSGVPVVELIAGAGRGCRITEIGIAIVNATASALGLGRPQAIGITPTTPVQLLSPFNGRDFSDAKLAVAWGTPPTVPLAYYRQCSLAATAGAERIWKFDPKIYLPSGGSIVLWTITTVSVADIYFVIEE